MTLREGLWGFKDISERDCSQGSRREDHLLLKHRPLVNKTAVGPFDLQLSGMPIRGRYFPFRPCHVALLSCSCRICESFRQFQSVCKQGRRHSRAPQSVLSQPEVTVIELVHASEEHCIDRQAFLLWTN